jgi:hypothetical protein
LKVPLKNLRRTEPTLAPICVDQFRQAQNASANLSELNKFSCARDRDVFIEKSGWATMPGSETANSAVATACAETLPSLKAGDVH